MKITVIALWLFGWQVAAWGGNLNNSAKGIDFLGYKFFHNHTLIRKSIKQEFKRKIKNKTATPQTQSAYWGWFKHADTFNLTQKYFKYERKS